MHSVKSMVFMNLKELKKNLLKQNNQKKGQSMSLIQDKGK